MWVQVAGYVASALVAVSFYMRTIIYLRLFAIASNVVFIVYGYAGQVYPVLVLHTFLLPLNLQRLWQMKKLISHVREASRGEMSLDFLVPYMRREVHAEGELLFARGSESSKVYYLDEGRIHLEEIGVYVERGELIGEIGLFAPGKQRTTSARCATPVVVHSISDQKIMELYVQNPSFGVYLMRLIIKRFIESYLKEGKDGKPVTDDPAS